MNDCCATSYLYISKRVVKHRTENYKKSRNINITFAWTHENSLFSAKNFWRYQEGICGTWIVISFICLWTKQSQTISLWSTFQNPIQLLQLLMFNLSKGREWVEKSLFIFFLTRSEKNLRGGVIDIELRKIKLDGGFSGGGCLAGWLLK